MPQLFLLASIAMQNVAVCGIRTVTIWQPNSFTNPPQFAFSPKLNFLVLPRIAFISGRIALIFQKPLFFTTFFRNFANS